MSTTEFGIRSGEFEAAGFDAAGEARGLYDPALAKDSCGVGFIADAGLALSLQWPRI
jgi:hypothetical protein